MLLNILQTAIHYSSIILYLCVFQKLQIVIYLGTPKHVASLMKTPFQRRSRPKTAAILYLNTENTYIMNPPYSDAYLNIVHPKFLAPFILLSLLFSGVRKTKICYTRIYFIIYSTTHNVTNVPDSGQMNKVSAPKNIIRRAKWIDRHSVQFT